MKIGSCLAERGNVLKGAEVLEWHWWKVRVLSQRKS